MSYSKISKSLKAADSPTGTNPQSIEFKESAEQWAKSQGKKFAKQLTAVTAKELKDNIYTQYSKISFSPKVFVATVYEQPGVQITFFVDIEYFDKNKKIKNVYEVSDDEMERVVRSKNKVGKLIIKTLKLVWKKEKGAILKSFDSYMKKEGFSGKFKNSDFPQTSNTNELIDITVVWGK